MPQTAANERTEYRYVVELLHSENSRQLAQSPVDVDFGPLLDWARFDRARRDRSAEVFLNPDIGQVQPAWDAELGEPHVEGLRVAFPGGEASESVAIPKNYFKTAAREAAKGLIKDGTLGEGDTFRYLICAYPTSEQEAAPQAEAGFTIEPVRQPLPLSEGRLEPLRAGAGVSGPDASAAFPVFIPQTVIDEATQLTEAAGAEETGGILIGHLRRDLEVGEIFAEVTAQIPARHARGELTRLTFNKETWTDVDAAIRLRKLKELYLGWWHSHPARQWCKDCPIENRKVCKLSGEFFSAHDVALHRTVFPQPYQVALVISDSYAHGLTWPLFGWHQGTVQQRGFYVLESGD